MFKPEIVFIFMLFFQSCSDSKGTGKSKIRLKISRKNAKVQKVSKPKGLRWAAAPGAIGDIDCVGVLVTYLDQPTGAGFCEDAAGDIVSSPHAVSISVAAGEVLEFEVNSGRVRIQVYGIDTAAACPDMKDLKNLDQTLYSAPYLIAEEAEIELEEGDQNLSLTGVLDTTIFANTCTDGPFFDVPPPPPGTALWDSNNWDGAGTWGP